MTHSDILLHLHCKKPVELSHQCKTFLGIEDDEIFTITEVIGNFEQLQIINQFNTTETINPNSIIN